MNSKKYNMIIIEVIPEYLRVSGGLIIALSPQVMNELDRRGLAYITIDDVLSLDDHNSMEPEYSAILHKWIDSLDAKITPHFKSLQKMNISPAKLYGYYLQRMIDSFMVNALFIKRLLDKYPSRSVTYYHCKSMQKSIDYQLFVKDSSLLSIMLTDFCRSLAIDYSEVSVKNENLVPNANHSYSILKKSYLGGRMLGRRIFNVFKNGFRKDAILFMKLGWEIEKAVSAAQEKGYRALYDYPKGKHHGNLRIENRVAFETDVFDDFAGIKFSHLFHDRLKYFVENICPYLDKRSSLYSQWLSRSRVKAVITHSKWELDDFAMMAAATASESTLAVQVDHGYSAFDCAEMWKFTELPCNLEIFISEEVMQYFQGHVLSMNQVKSVLAGAWLAKFVNLPRNVFSQKCTTVLYVPTLISSNTYRVDGASYFPTWYYKHQAGLLKYFATESNYKFIFKGLRHENSDDHTVRELIEGSYGRNISYEDGPLIEALQRCDFVITDYPSTPLYEAMVAGKPVLGLYHTSLRIRNSAKQFFGPILRGFSTSAEAIETIRCFLRDDKTLYQKRVDMPAPGIMKVIDNHLRDIVGKSALHGNYVPKKT